MLVRMYEVKAVMDAGRERFYVPGETYAVSPVVGAQWVRAGVAAEATSSRPLAPTPPKKRKATQG